MKPSMMVVEIQAHQLLTVSDLKLHNEVSSKDSYSRSLGLDDEDSE